ncbi:CvpA family protein [Metabacillus arenae]|uniref:CvpA family protein n=1 Tax=Metabacillus arenae TaxID=2771434 RepID=A0A926NNP1_9BACI|nr:CvpA family protein [Metabacillus arenae]MBD1381141.1 CvpA family protein [Metabacillus arenae]
MLDLALIAILVIGTLVGLKRGFILQFIHLTGFIISYIVAYKYYDDLAPKLTLWVPYPTFGEGSEVISFLSGDNLENAYYNAVAFVLLFIGTKIVMHIVGSMLDFVTLLPILKQLNRWAGGILGFLEIYLILLILLFIGGLVPIEQFQTALNGSVFANLIVHHTPYFSDMINELWLKYGLNS